jgi:hypothetical protein
MPGIVLADLRAARDRPTHRRCGTHPQGRHRADEKAPCRSSNASPVNRRGPPSGSKGYRRFARTLADTGARLRADAVRYSFIAVDSHHLQVNELHVALNDPESRTEAAAILRTLIDRITVSGDEQGHVLELTGNIVKLLALPGAQVPATFESSVKVLRG